MPSRAFRTRFHEFNRRKGTIQDRDRIIVAVSGGVDSGVLLDLLAKEQEACGLTLVVAHFNFQLRGAESDADETFVARRAHHYGLEFYAERADTNAYAHSHKMGIQEAARTLRYEFFDNLLLSSGFDKIATAHHADDNAETIIMNVVRGAGVAGLAGIPLFRKDRRIIRPLLFAERPEIEAFAAEEKIPFRVDASNEKDDYTRNFIRQHILPRVKEKVNPNVVATLGRSAEVFRELEVFLKDTARQNYEYVVLRDTTEELHLSVARLRTYPALMQQYLVMLAAEAFANINLDFDQVSHVLALTEGLTGSRVDMDKAHVVFRDRDHLVFRKMEIVPDFRFAVQPERQYTFERFAFSSHIMAAKGTVLNGKDAEYVDADKIAGEELILRSWRDGDWFVPLGMNSRKKISDFFVDAKIPVYEKPFIPILETKSGDVVWVCGYRIDDRFKVTTETKRIMKLHFSLLQP